MIASGLFDYGIGIGDVWQLLAGTLVAGGLSATTMTAIARSTGATELASGAEKPLNDPSLPAPPY